MTTQEAANTSSEATPVEQHDASSERRYPQRQNRRLPAIGTGKTKKGGV